MFFTKNKQPTNQLHIYTDTGLEFQLPNQDKSYKLRIYYILYETLYEYILRNLQIKYQKNLIKFKIFQIKQQIEEAQIAKIDQQLLKIAADQSIILNDDKSLQDYGITFENQQGGKLNQNLKLSYIALFNSKFHCSKGELLLCISQTPIIMRVNLSHTLKRHGSFVNNKSSTQQLQIPLQDTSGGSALIPSSQDELELKTYSNCSIYTLKSLIMKNTAIPISDQVLSYQGQTLDNTMPLSNYGIFDHTYNNSQKQGSQQNMSNMYRNNSTGDNSISNINHHMSSQIVELNEYEVTLITMKKKPPIVPSLNFNSTQNHRKTGLTLSHLASNNYNSNDGNGHNSSLLMTQQPNQDLHSSFQVSLGIDFTFNTIKNVKKVNWKDDAPWYREISDGLSWICYCQNPKCLANKQMVVINKGYGVYSIKKEMTQIKCPCCLTGKYLEVKNSGFVNCEWAMRGILNRNKESKIYADGKTYDSKLYTFKECDYKTIWFALDIMVKQLDEKTALRNLPSAREDKVKNNQMIDKALEQEGVPLVQIVKDKGHNKNNEFDADSDSSFTDSENGEDQQNLQNNPNKQETTQKQPQSEMHLKKHEKQLMKIQNIQYLPSNRGPRGAFCCTDNGIAVGCTGKSLKVNTQEDVQPPQDDKENNTKCIIF